MITTEHLLISRVDDLRISTLIVEPEIRPWAVLQLSHGMCGCKERFLPFMHFMAEKGIVCIANDHRGHGRSVWTSADLGYMYESGYQALVEDMKTVHDFAASRYPELPYFLLGHSMGALAARLYAKKWDRDLVTLVLCGIPYSPLYHIARPFLKCMCSMGFGHVRAKSLQNLSSRIFNRKFSAEGFQAWTCSDPEVRKSFAEDPNCNYSFTYNASFNLMSMMRSVYSVNDWLLENPELPIYFLYGADDPCVFNGQSIIKNVSLCKKRGYKNLYIKEFPAMRHEILNEIGKESVWTYLYAQFFQLKMGDK